MTKQRFSVILKECGFDDQQITILWGGRPSDDIDEATLRRTSERIAPIKDSLVQA